jgi:soluble lytic murein transglycosylase-like protein
VAALFCIVTLTLFSCSAFGADLAVLTNGFSIRHEHRLVMGETTRLYLSADDSSFMDVPTAEIAGYERDLAPPAPGDAYASLPTPFASAKAESSQAQSVKPQSGKSAPALSEVVNTASAAYHLDPDLVNSVIHAESGFNSHAVSPKGARGLMQLMPGTASQLGVNDVFDAQANVEGGSRYLRELLERYNFDLIKALAAYNAGPERVEKYRGVPPFRETRAYVARIVHEYNTKKIAQEKEAKRKQILAKQISAKTTTKTQGPTPTVVRASSKPATITAEAVH